MKRLSESLAREQSKDLDGQEAKTYLVAPSQAELEMRKAQKLRELIFQVTKLTSS